jgi:glycosyltransferase involved in cell wall biosynthesis
MDGKPTINVIIPTLNEAESIGQTIDQIPRGDHLKVTIVDGNSTDATRDIAESKGAEIIVEPRKGYGRAYKTGFDACTSDIIVTFDGDTTYPAEMTQDLADILIRDELDFISCDRLTNLKPEAMTRGHRFGNWVLVKTMNVLFSMKLKDSQTGMWVFRSEIWPKLDVISDGMPFSQEIKIEAWKKGFRAREIAVDYRPRIGEIKLNTWGDGRRNFFYFFKKRWGHPTPED